MADVYRLPAKKKTRTFKFQDAEGTVYEVPIVDELPIRYLSNLQTAATKANGSNKRKKQEGQAEMLAVFLDVLDEYCPGITSELDSTSLEGLLEAWTAAGETDLGES